MRLADIITIIIALIIFYYLVVNFLETPWAL